MSKSTISGGTALLLLSSQVFAAELGVSAGADAKPDADRGSVSGAGAGDTNTKATLAGDGDAAKAERSSTVPEASSWAGSRASRSPNPYESSARFATVPYLRRYAPQGNLWEMGLFLGVLAPAFDHNLKVPTTEVDSYNGASVNAGGRIAYFPLSFVGLEAEGMASASATRETNRSALFYAARGHAVLQLPYYSIVPFAVVGGGALGAVSGPMGHDGDPAFHFGLGAKIPFTSHVSARLDLRDTLTQARDQAEGSAAHHFEVLLGGTFTLERTPPPPPKDSDFDGLMDGEDSCPDQAALTLDGCLKDSDSDGVSDDRDACPQVQGEAKDGCPAENPDRDGDKVPNLCDRCPDAAGTLADGCPNRDADKDGFEDEKDKCPKEPETKNGFEDADGCPDQVPEAVKKFSGVMRGIVFKQGSAEIDKSSFVTLDEAHQTLTNFPSIRIEVSGHTSSEGAEAVNQKLSTERAEAVRRYLVEKGVAPDRLLARGAGSTEPIADNASRAGREQNRRIEFRVLAEP